MNKRKKYYFAALFFFGSFFSFSQAKEIDSLKLLLKTGKEDTLRVNLLNKLCGKLSGGTQTEEMFLYATEADKLAEKLRFARGKAAACRWLGKYFLAKANYPAALKFDLQALNAYTDAEDKKGMAGALHSIGYVYYFDGSLDLALEYYFKAMKINLEINNSPWIKSNLANIALAYFYKNDFKNSILYNKKSIELSEKLNDKNAAPLLLVHISEDYVKLGLPDTALLYVNKALKYASDNKIKISETFAYKTLGLIYLKMGKSKLAIQYLEKQMALVNTGKDWLEGKKDLSKFLSDAYYADGQYEKAVKLYKNYIVLHDSIFNTETAKKMVQQQMQYDFDKKSAADSIKNSEAKKFEEVKHQQEISKQKTFTYGGIIGFLVMIVVAGISYNAFRNKKKANIEIQRQKHLVEEKQKEILDSIYYARRIQRALITSEKYIERNLNELNG